MTGDVITTHCVTQLYVKPGVDGTSRRLVKPGSPCICLGLMTSHETLVVSDDGSTGWIMITDIDRVSARPVCMPGSRE